MKKIIFLCLVLNGCYVYHCPPNYVYQPPREVPVYAPAPATTQRVIKRTVRRTVRIVPASELEGAIK